MGTNSRIEWTDDSFSPWFGCTQISEACVRCYAKDWAERFHKAVWNGPPTRAAASTLLKPFELDRKAAKAGQRRRVFMAHYGDFFDNQAPEQWRADAWRDVAACTNLDWLILTKRPQNIAKMLPAGWPWPHVWLGTTTENQQEADRRLPILLEIPAIVHFASVEPQLEPVNLAAYLAAGLDWVIVGGESGKGCRPFNPDWARSLRDQCRASNAAFFMKQLGGHPDKRDAIEDLPHDLRIREWPQVRAS